MPEYRELRRSYRILDIIKTPELACRVTMQPVEAFDIDAAIVFADILPPLEAMGLQLEFQHGEGPVIHNPVRDRASIRSLTVPDVEEALWFTLEAVRLARLELDGRGVPLIGFSGAPFTLACYAVEGGGSVNFNRAKVLMMSEPAAWHELMDKLSELVGRYLLAQAGAGAQALQFFDSWAGVLSPDDYREYVLPHSQHALEIAAAGGVPLIHFGTGTGCMLELVREAGGDVIGLDWRTDLAAAWERLGHDVAVQGNLDPACLLAPWPEVERRARAHPRRCGWSARTRLQSGPWRVAADAAGYGPPSCGFRPRLRAKATGVKSRPHVVIVGGGIAGLSTAWFLQKEAAIRGLDLSYTVLEQSNRWGGKVLTDIVDTEGGAFAVEGGADSFLTGQKPWGVQLAVELGLAPRLLGTNDKARKVYVLNNGKPLALPEGVFLLVPTRFKPFVLSPLISLLGKIRMGMDLVIPAKKGDADETLAQFVTRRLGAEALDKIAEPLMSGIYNAEAERQSLLATFPRFREQERQYGSLIRAMVAARRNSVRHAPPSDESGEDAPKTSVPASLFVSFQDGTEELIRGLVSGLKGNLQTGARLTSLERGADGGLVLGLAQEGGQAETRMLEADAVVLAVPSFAAADLVRAHAPAAAHLLAGIRYVSTGTISLGYAGDHAAERLPGFGLVIPRSERKPLNAVTWSSTKFDHRAPKGHSLLRAFFGGSRSPESMELSDEELLAMTRRELATLAGVKAEPLFSRVYRWHRANPQYDVDHLQRVDALEAALPDGVYVTGSPYRGVGVPDCARQAEITAGMVLAGLEARLS